MFFFNQSHSFKNSMINLMLLMICTTSLLAQESSQTKGTPSILSLLQEATNAEENNNKEQALRSYQKILTINPRNKKALLGIKKLTKTIKRSDQEIQEEARTSLLQEVEKTWEIASREKNSSYSHELLEKETTPVFKNDDINTKLNSLIIPHVDLEDATIGEAIDYLRQKSCTLDPNHRGINIILTLPPREGSAGLDHPETVDTLPEPHIFLELHEVPIYTALEYVAKQAGLAIHLDSYAVVLLPESAEKEDLITKEYVVTTPFPPQKKDEDNQKEIISFSARNFLEQEGITFPEGAFASYLEASHKLIIRNTKENIGLIDVFMSASQKNTLAQVSIETKFLEVSQEQLEHLGFTWLLGSYELGHRGIDLSGKGGADMLHANVSRIPMTAMNSLGNLHADSSAIQENSIDTAINNENGEGSTSHSMTGIFSIAGVYTDPQFQVILQALQEKKGVDLMAAPHVTTRDGVQATVKIIDEFIYPTEYAPPQIPQSTTNSGGNILHESPPTIAPSFPSAWTKKDLGVVLEAKPTIGPDGYTIDLELHPQITDFDGFINYGSPINTIGYSFSANNASAIPFSSTLTTNTINQPVFTVREVNTSVTVYDGQTVVLGGLIREDIQKFEEKIPFLGDIPLAGRLFRSKSNKKMKKNLIIFVTPRILNQEGSPLLPQHLKK